MREENRFENILASLRVRKGWTQEDAAAHISKGMSRHTYSDLETGKLPPSPKHLKLLAAGFKLNQEDTDALYYAAHHGSPKVHNLPFHRNRLFTGRERQLEQLGKHLQETGTVEITQSVSISGLGGIGKTQLALEYAHRQYQKVYRAVFWVNAADGATLGASFDSLARILGLLENDKRGPEQSIEAVKRWLEEHTSWLLIMDNADNLPLARTYFPINHRGHILLTTRSQIVGNIAKRIEIEEMEPEEGLLFLLRRSGALQGGATLDMVAADIRESALHLVEILGYHPLALDQAGAYIEETGISFTDYTDLCHKEGNLLLDRRGLLGEMPGEHPESVAATLGLSIAKARERHPLVSDILHFCAFLQPDAIPEELFNHDDSLVPGTAFNEAITALRRYSLIKRNAQDKTLSIHRLIQAVLIDSMDPNLQMYWKERVGRPLNVCFPWPDFRSGNWTLCDRYLANVITHASWGEHDPTPAVEVGELYYKAGSYVLTRLWLSVAEDLLPRAYASFAQHFGDWHPKTMQVLATLATLYMMQGKNEQAEILLPQLIAAQTEQLGLTHPDTISCMQLWAGLYINLGAYGQAEKIVNQLADLVEERWEYDNLLADIFWHQGKYEQAEPLFRQTLNILEKNYAADDPRIPSALYGIATILVQRREHKEATQMFERGLHIQERLYGASHLKLQEMRELIAMLKVVVEMDSTDHTAEPSDKPLE